MGFGIIAGAMAGAAGATGDIAQGYIENQRRATLAKQIADIDEQKALRIDEHRRALDWEGMLRDQTDPTLNSARNKNLQTELATRGAAATQQARDMIPIAAEQQQKVGGIKVGQDIASAKGMAAAQAEQAVANGNNPAFLRAQRNITQASHFFGPADALATEQLKMLKAQDAVKETLAKTTDPAQRDILQQQLADLTGNTKSTKELSVALAQTETAAAKARQTLADPMATQEAKDSAREAMASLEASAANLRKHLGVKTPEKEYPQAPDAAIAALRKDPKLASQFDAKYGKGAAERAMGATPSASATKPPVIGMKQDDMAGITFAGDGYSFEGKTYATPAEAKAARDSKPRSTTAAALQKYGD